MKYGEIIEQTPAFREMLADIEAGRPAHGYLLVSHDSAALNVLARLFIGRLEGIDAAGNLADILVYSDKMTAETAGDIALLAYLTPVELSRRYYIIGRGEELNESCQNKLLKTFEEPPPASLFLVLTGSAEALLPTVRSRLRTIRMLPLGEQLYGEAVARYFGNSGFVAAMGDGSLTAAEKFSDPVYNELLSETVELLTKMRRSSEILPFAARLNARKDYLKDIIDILEVLLHDCTAYSLGRPDAVKLKFLMPDVRELAATYDADVALRERDVLMRARRRLDSYGNMTSVIDELLFSLLEVKAKCQR